MISKILSSPIYGIFRYQPTIVSSGFNFCTATGSRQEPHPLRNKILNISSFDEFNNFFKDKKQDFDPSCYSLASRTLAKILIESKLILNYQHRESLKTYLTSLQKIDIDALNLQEFSQLLYLLRIIKNDPNNNNLFVNIYIRSILERSQSKAKELELDASLNRLAYFYQEFSCLNSRYSHTVARRVNSILQNSNSEVENQCLSINELNLILKGMRSKNQISTEELLLLRNIIRTVIQKYLDKLSFLELAQISVGINEVVANNTSDIINQSQAETIHKKILDNIDEMDEKSIMHILNGKKTSNRTYQQIYKIIFDKILDEIQPNGESSFNELFTLRLFNGICDKIKLRTTTPENQDKFFAFLRFSITKTPRFINSFIENYITKGFFTYKHLIRVVQILESIPDFHFKLTLLFELCNKRVDVEKLLSFDKLKEIELREKSLIMMTSIIESLSEKQGPNKQVYIETLTKLKDRFFELYKVEDESFSKLVFSLENNLLPHLVRLFRKDYDSKFPSPLETEQSEKYRNAWLKTVVFGTQQVTFAKRYSNQIKEKINAKDIEFLLRSISLEQYSSKDVLSNVLLLVIKRFDLVLQNQNILVAVGKLLSLELNSIPEDSTTDPLKSKFWHILNESADKLEPSRYFDIFSTTIFAMLKSNLHMFKYSEQYKALLEKWLQKSEGIKGKHVAGELLTECLRLNLIKREHLVNLSQKLKDTASEHQATMLKMIETNEFALEGVQIARNNLYLFLFNYAPETVALLEKNSEKIQGLIDQMRPREIWKCITHFRLGSRKPAALILNNLFKSLNKFTLNFEEFNPVFLGEVLKRNNFEKHLNQIDNIKSFFKSSLEFFTQRNKVHKFSLEDHIGLIRAANDYRVRNDDHIHAVLDYYANDPTIWKRELYLLAGQIGVELNKNELHRLVESNLFNYFTSSFSKCFTMFLLYEKQLEKPGEVLLNLVNKYNQLKQKEKVPVYSLFYDYLRKVYPEETKNFEPNHLQKADFCKSLESLNSKSLNILREAFEAVTETKFVENNLSNNFYYTFRSVAFVFPAQSKYHGDNVIIKRILQELTGVDKYVLINRRNSNLRSTIKYISANFKGLITVEEEEAIVRKINEKYQSAKEPVEEEQGQEAPVAEEKTQTK